MHRRSKKRKDEEALMLVDITRRFLSNKNWAESETEESFVDQHLLPIMQVIFLNDPMFAHSRSIGRIPLSNSSLLASNSVDTCMKLKPDFCVKYNFKGSSVGFLVVEVKLPNVHPSQILSDRSKLGVELKRIIDEQIVQGSYEPKSFGVLVEGFRCTFFACSLDESRYCLFAKLEKHWLLQSPDDMMQIPDLVIVCMKLKTAMIEAAGKLNKRIKQDKTLHASVKPTVGLPTQRAS